MRGKIGVVIPTRGDRGLFLKQCLSMLEGQSLKPDVVKVIDEEPKGLDKDITYRYKKGFEYLFKKGCEVVFLIEDDDFYSDKYIEIMYANWLLNNRPQIYGLAETTYYHLSRKAYRTMKHQLRSSAFSTMVSPAVLNIDYPADNYPFLDLEMWKQLEGKTLNIQEPICLGIKHGVGVCGGKGHNEDFPYDSRDDSLIYLRKVTGKHFNFYRELIK